MKGTSIREFLAKGNRAKWFVFVLFCLILFAKTILFHWYVGYTFFHIPLRNYYSIIVFWCAKIAPALFIGSFVFITKRIWWTVFLNLAIDIWAIANLFYFKAYNMFMSVEVILLADNMDGFWSSLLSYMGFDVYSFIILSVFYILIIKLFNLFIIDKGKSYLMFVIFFVLSLFIESVVNSYIQIKNYEVNSNVTDKSADKNMFFCPFGGVYRAAKYESWMDHEGWARNYVRQYSIISYFPSEMLYNTLIPKNTEAISLCNTDLSKIELLVEDPNADFKIPKTNVVFVLFESLESWPINDVMGWSYMPNLINLSKEEHVLFCDKLISQTKFGNSADGQMTSVSGLLPISNGAACKYYGRNIFPNYAHFFKNSAIINPVPNIWNQTVMTNSYKFNELIEPNPSYNWEGDSGVINAMKHYSFSRDFPFCVLGITVDSHPPFWVESPYHIEKGMPQLMSAYLNCLHYTDSCVGILIDTILNSHLAENTTIVITGDHTIFRSESVFTDMTDYAKKNHIDFKAGHTFTPLIVYSPQIDGNIHVTDTCYQMDIFPTVLDLIGKGDYFWHGFGVNVMDSVARNNRKITEKEAYRLSDLMIRSDYFRQYYLNDKEEMDVE